MRIRKLVCELLVAVMMCAVFTACGKGNENNQPVSTQAVELTATPDATEAPMATEAPKVSEAPAVTEADGAEDKKDIDVKPDADITTVPTGAEVTVNGSDNTDIDPNVRNNETDISVNTGANEQSFENTCAGILSDEEFIKIMNYDGENVDTEEYAAIAFKLSAFLENAVNREFPAFVSFENCDEKAKEAAAEFIDGYYHYDSDRVFASIANPGYMWEEVMDFCENAEDELAEFRLIKSAVVGGKSISREEYDKYGFEVEFADISDVTDLQMFGTRILAMDIYNRNEIIYTLVATGMFEGEYKVVAALEIDYDEVSWLAYNSYEYEVDAPDTDISVEGVEDIAAAEKLLKKEGYTFTGSESAEEIVRYFLEALTIPDGIKMMSCVAYDMEHCVDFLENIENADDFENSVDYRDLFPEGLESRCEIESLEPVTGNPADIFYKDELYVLPDNVKDISVAKIAIKSILNGNEVEDDEENLEVYVGLTDGVYRILTIRLGDS